MRNSRDARFVPAFGQPVRNSYDKQQVLEA